MLSFYLSMVETEEERNLISDLYTRYEQKMYYAALGILHNQHSAEDAVHEAFLRIINNLHKLYFENDKKTEALVVIIVKNVALNMLKKDNRTTGEYIMTYVSNMPKNDVENIVKSTKFK